MNIKHITSISSTILLLGSTSLAFADHNSVWGEGWANMPNDIHNTRVDTLNTDGGQDTFRDFVRYGEGSTSVNRFTSDSPSRSSMSSNRSGSRSTNRNQRGGGRGGRR